MPSGIILSTITLLSIIYFYHPTFFEMCEIHIWHVLKLFEVYLNNCSIVILVYLLIINKINHCRQYYDLFILH